MESTNIEKIMESLSPGDVKELQNLNNDLLHLAEGLMTLCNLLKDRTDKIPCEGIYALLNTLSQQIYENSVKTNAKLF